MSPLRTPAKSHEQLHYESMITFLKWAIGIAGGMITVIAGIAIYVSYSDRNAMREEYSNAIKELKGQIAEIKTDAKDKTQSVKDDAKREISSITLSTSEMAIRETQKQIANIFETNKIQDLIETKAVAEIQQKMTPLIERQTISVSSITDAAAGMRAGQYREMVKLKGFFQHPKNSFDSLIAKNMYDQICQSFEMGVLDQMKYLQPLSFSITDNRLPTVSAQLSELRSNIELINDPASPLQYVAQAIVMLSKASHQDFKPFEIDKINTWFKSLK